MKIEFTDITALGTERFLALDTQGRIWLWTLHDALGPDCELLDSPEEPAAPAAPAQSDL